jgi:hypothetical protein
MNKIILLFIFFLIYFKKTKNTFIAKHYGIDEWNDLELKEHLSNLNKFSNSLTIFMVKNKIKKLF